MKRLLSLLLCSCIVLLTSSVAMGDVLTEDTVQTVLAKNAYVSNVNEYGTNLNTDIVDNNQNTLADTNLQVVYSSEDNSLSIMGTVNGENIELQGFPEGRSENSNVIYFNGINSNEALSIVNFSYEKNIEQSNMYFKNYMETNISDSESILKIYLKYNNRNSNDYILLEAFNCMLPYDDEFINSLPQNSLLGAWVATQFKPIKSESSSSTRATTTYFNKTISETFYDMGLTQTHTIKLKFSCDYANIPIGQEATEIYRIAVIGKTTTVPDATNYNSSTQSWLHVNAIKLRQTSVPYTAFRGVSIDGSVQNNGLGGSLSARIGVSYGLLGLSYSIPITFTDEVDVDIDETYTGYDNSASNYARSIETEIDSDFKLTQIDHYFEVISILRDYGNASRSASTLKAKWDIEIINAGLFTTSDYSYSQNVSISVK